MKRTYYLLLFLIIQFQSFSQESKLIIEVIEKMDRTFSENDSLYLENWGIYNISDLYVAVDSAGIMLSNATYSVSSDSLFIVDSIYSTQNRECLFSELDTFMVIDNNQMIFKNSTLRIKYEYDNYSLLFANDKKSIEHWIVSNSQSHRILFDENKNYIFLSRIRKLTLDQKLNSLSTLSE